MDEIQDLGEHLHRYGLKNTKARSAVLHLLIAKAGVLTPDDIYQVLQEQGKPINVSTIYRILEMFTEKGLTEKSYLPDLRKYGFSLRSVGHQHRLICLCCHKIVELPHCPLTTFEQDVAQKTQFEVVGHQLELYGYCPECQKKRHATQHM